MTGIQIVLSVFALFALSRVVLRFRRGDLPLLHLVMWFVFWSGAIFAILLPGTISAIATVLRVGRGADFVIYVALMLLFYLQFKTLGKLEDLERQITRVVRAAALKELDDNTSPRKALPPTVPPPRVPPAP